MFSPVENREQINQIISRRIEQAILSKEYMPGSKIPSEFELCRQFEVSRTSVREALKTLNAQGLIKIIKGKGVFVNHISADSVTDPLVKYLKMKLDRDYVLDLVQARQIIEPGIAYHAALQRTDADIERLENDLNKLDKCETGFIELARLDMAFHLHLAEASKNSIIHLILDPIHRLIPEVSSVYAAVSDAREVAQEWHRKILKAVKNKEADKAGKAMMEHLKKAEDHAKRVLDTQSKKPPHE